MLHPRLAWFGYRRCRQGAQKMACCPVDAVTRRFRLGRERLSFRSVACRRVDARD